MGKNVYYTRQPQNQTELEKLKIKVLREKHVFFVCTIVGIVIGGVMSLVASPLMGALVLIVFEVFFAIPGLIKWQKAKLELMKTE